MIIIRFWRNKSRVARDITSMRDSVTTPIRIISPQGGGKGRRAARVKRGHYTHGMADHNRVCKLCVTTAIQVQGRPIPTTILSDGGMHTMYSRLPTM